MADSCIKCKKEVRKRQEAILCDKCEKWCHRTCGTGIDRSVYRRMVKGGVRGAMGCDEVGWGPMNGHSTQVYEDTDFPWHFLAIFYKREAQTKIKCFKLHNSQP